MAIRDDSTIFRHRLLDFDLGRGRGRGRAVHSRVRFEGILEHEMLRAERAATPLSLLMFSMGEAAGVFPNPLLERIDRETRSIDILGWLDSGQLKLALLMPSTSPDGARRVMERLLEGDPPDTSGVSSHLRWRILAYPRSSGHGGVSDLEYNPWEDLTSAFSSSSPPREDLDRPVVPDVGFCLPTPTGKRLLDRIAAVLGLLVLSPVFLLIAAAIKLDSRGPVFFRQRRVGRGGRTFTLWKFRSMTSGHDRGGDMRYVQSLIACDGANAHQPMTKLDSINRDITPVGAILRHSFLDELPQLINVLRGEMSLIGPRPCLPCEADVYAPWHRRRFAVLPGMTGLWQVAGKNQISFEEMVRLDIRYAMEASPLLDLWVLLRTARLLAGRILATSMPERRENAPCPAKQESQ